MPFTFSAGSFSFLRSSTTSQSNIEQNNNVDNVNKNNINDNLDIGNNNLPLDNNLNVIPLERSRSLDNPTSLRTNRPNNNNNPKNVNKKAWYKSIFVRIHHTLSLSRWNVEDYSNNTINKLNNVTINSRNVIDYSINAKNNDLVDTNKDHNDNEINDIDDIGTVGDDDPIMMKSRSNVPETKKNSFVRHGNVHDFYITKKDRTLKNGTSRHHRSVTLDEGRSSVFEKCAQTPRHFAKETEVLGKVGRFTIVREREDFDTTYFDQCHCQQKPCRFSTNGCSGTHPILPPESLPQLHSLQQQQQQQQQAMMIAHQQMLYSSRHHSWSSAKPPRSIYCNVTPSYNSSRHSLNSLQNNAMPIVVSKASSSSSSSSSSPTNRGVLSQSASSPNLVHLNQRPKCENMNKNPSRNNNGRSSSSIVISGKNPNHPNNNGSYYSQYNTTSVVKKARKPSLVNIKSTESVESSCRSSALSTSVNSSSAPSTPMYPIKLSHNPNEPHTTINSHSGRKFEVEWTTNTKSSSSSSTSSTSSSDPSPSPPSTISSVFSVASSPDKSVTSTLSRRCSTLSSKCGRKFEVTILSGNALLNTSPHSTIDNNVAEIIAANTDSTKA